MPVILSSVPWQPSPYMTGYWFTPSGVTEHRTIGRYQGDVSVLTRALVPSVHFIVGQDDGEWCQTQYADMIAYHAAGANNKKVGIEISGQNSDVEDLTQWQRYALGVIHRELAEAFGWPFPAPDGLYDGERLFIDQYDPVLHLNHRNVGGYPAYYHSDFIYQETYQAAVSASPTQEEDDVKGIFVHGPGSYFVWFINNGVRIATTSKTQIDTMAFIGHSSNNSENIFEWSWDQINSFPLWDPTAKATVDVQSIINSVVDAVKATTPTLSVDYDAIAKKVNDDAAERLRQR